MEFTVLKPNHGGDTLVTDYPAVIDFSQKMELTVLRPNHGGDTLGAILGPIGSHWVKKNGSKRRKLPCPEILIFDNPAVLTPIGSHWVQKMGQNVENYHAPKFKFSTTWLSSIIPKIWKLRLWRQITVGTPFGPSWGQWGPIGSKKWVKT